MGAFLAPFMYGLYWKKVTKAAVWASFATSVLITVANMFFKFIESPINVGAVAWKKLLLYIRRGQLRNKIVYKKCFNQNT